MSPPPKYYRRVHSTVHIKQNGSFFIIVSKLWDNIFLHVLKLFEKKEER